LRSIRISRFGLVLSCESGVGRGKGTPNSVVENGCTLTKINQSKQFSSPLTFMGKVDMLQDDAFKSKPLCCSALLFEA
jgi:hypothetical protein